MQAGRSRAGGAFYERRMNMAKMKEQIRAEVVMAMNEKIKLLQDENKRLWNTLRRINEGIKHEYGHSDADRYNQVLLNWNKIIGEALKARGITMQHNINHLRKE